ncbi:MAG: tRNA dihydrouridine synthase DusB [Candidatus Eisenbacteria bacterium]|nr:tRNA dihydrouridine synthase DusB [Candidatus Eisenbacteria bacterium]
MIRIGHVPVDPPFVLAPMAGITDKYFRLILKRIGGVGVVTMEFISSEALTRGIDRTRRMMTFAEEERPISIQIYGSRADRMADAAQLVEDEGSDIVDINMGCPANKILKGCAGCSLMGDLDNAKEIIRAVRRRVTIPLTVKFRLGLRETALNFLELGKICEGEGVNAVALHGRTAKQMFGGRADWDRISELKNALTIPVMGNGDVNTPADAVAMFRQTGCDLVMIGRASMKNPWIFQQCASELRGETWAEPTAMQRRDLILEHFRLLLAGEDEKTAFHKIRTFAGWYTHGLPGGRGLRQKINGIPDSEGFMRAVEAFFEELLHTPEITILEGV